MTHSNVKQTIYLHIENTFQSLDGSQLLLTNNNKSFRQVHKRSGSFFYKKKAWSSKVRWISQKNGGRRLNSAPGCGWGLVSVLVSGVKSWRLIGSKEIPYITAPNQVRCCINPLVCCPLPLSGVGNDSLQKRKEGEGAPTKWATGLKHSDSRREGKPCWIRNWYIHNT